MQIFGVVFLYFLKLSAGKGFLRNNLRDVSTFRSFPFTSSQSNKNSQRFRLKIMFFTSRKLALPQLVTPHLASAFFRNSPHLITPHFTTIRHFPPRPTSPHSRPPYLNLYHVTSLHPTLPLPSSHFTSLRLSLSIQLSSWIKKRHFT